MWNNAVTGAATTDDKDEFRWRVAEPDSGGSHAPTVGRSVGGSEAAAAAAAAAVARACILLKTCRWTNKAGNERGGKATRLEAHDFWTSRFGRGMSNV